jgi:diguanylate cyclase (GGDEF)-like protein
MHNDPINKPLWHFSYSYIEKTGKFMSYLNISKVLVIDKSARFRRQLSHFFSQIFPNAEVKEYEPEQGCPDHTFPWHEFDLLIMNFKLGTNGSGLDWLKICKTGENFPATIITTDQGHEKIAVRAFRYGAHDYLNKDGLSISLLKKSVHRAMNKHAGETSVDDTQLLQNKLINRVKLYQRLDDAHEDGALLLVSIDDFDEIHNKNGLLAADDLGSHVADVIVETSSAMDINDAEIIRMNDDTIAVIMLGAEDDNIYADFSKELCNKISASPFEHDGKPIDYNISIGVTFIKESSHGAKTNISCADAAVRLAMESDENSFIVFGGDAQTTNVADQKLVLHIQDSIKEDRVQPFFQPIISVSEATEVLDTTIYQLRTKLIDLNGQLLGYNDFFPILKQNKLVKNLDFWVIRHAIERLHKIKIDGQDKIGFLISLEEESLLGKGLVKWIDSLIDHYKDPGLASSIMFEIRSEQFIALQDSVLDIMMSLRDKYGISFALTNVHGLSILKTCTHKTSFEFVKIPMYTTSDAGDKAINTDELRQLIASSSEQGSLTIAEKIDNADYLSTAIECGADFVSGYLVHPPQEDISSDYEVVM